MAFSPGDIVQLKSGGAAMTVVAETAEGVHCIWHGQPPSDLKSGVIPAACLDVLELDDDEFDPDTLGEDDEDLQLDLEDGDIVHPPKDRRSGH